MATEVCLAVELGSLMDSVDRKGDRPYTPSNLSDTVNGLLEFVPEVRHPVFFINGGVMLNITPPWVVC